MIDFAKMFILFLFAMGIGYSMISISKRGLRYKKYLAKKGKETEAKVIKIIKNIDYDSYTYMLEYDAENKKRGEIYHLKQLWNVHQNSDFKKAHPLRSKMTIKYDRRAPERFIVTGDENNKKEFVDCQIFGYCIMVVSLILFAFGIWKL